MGDSNRCAGQGTDLNQIWVISAVALRGTITSTVLSAVVCRKSGRGKGVRAEKTWTSSRGASPSAQVLAVCVALVRRPQRTDSRARYELLSFRTFRSSRSSSVRASATVCPGLSSLLVAFSAPSTSLLSQRSTENSSISCRPFTAPSICGPERSRSRRWTARGENRTRGRAAVEEARGQGRGGAHS